MKSLKVSNIINQSMLDYINKANELNTNFPSLKAEVVKSWDGSKIVIKVCNSDKAKTLRELYKNFNFTF